MVRLPVRQFSKLLVSATHPHFHRILLLNCTAKIIRFFDLCKYFALSLPTAPLVEHPPLTPSSPHRGTSEALIGKPRQGAQRDHTVPRPSYNTPPQAYKPSPLRARTLLSRLFEEETYLYETMTLGKAEGSTSKGGASPPAKGPRAPSKGAGKGELRGSGIYYIIFRRPPYPSAC